MTSFISILPWVWGNADSEVSYVQKGGGDFAKKKTRVMAHTLWSTVSTEATSQPDMPLYANASQKHDSAFVYFHTYLLLCIK